MGTPQEPRRPRPWVAATLSLGAPGLGQLYAGERRAALVFAALSLALPLLTTWLFTVEAFATSRPVVLAAFGGNALLLLVSSAHASRAAARGSGLGLRGPVLVALGLLYTVLLFVAGIGVTRMVRAAVAQPIRMPTEAMLPTLVAGDYFWVDKRVFLRREPERGEVVVFRVPLRAPAATPPGRAAGPASTVRVARLVGLPGDVVELRGGVLRVNGTAVPAQPVGRPILQHEVGARLDLWEETLDGHRYRVARDPAHPSPDFGPAPVPETRYFVLCDDRDHALDSRVFGAVPRQALLGPATTIYWSWIEPFAPVRWERIGLRIDAPGVEIR